MWGAFRRPAVMAVLVVAWAGFAPLRAAPFEVIGDASPVLMESADHLPTFGTDGLDGRSAPGAWDDPVSSVDPGAPVVDLPTMVGDSSASSAVVFDGDACCPETTGCRAAACDAPGLWQHQVRQLRHLFSHHDLRRLAEKNACWALRADTLGLWRSSPRDRPLFSFVDGGAEGGTALDAGQLVSDPLVAPRLSLLRDDGCHPILEASYLWAGNFYSERSLPFLENGYATSPPGIYGNEWGPATDTSLNSAQAKLIANLQTAELNLRERFLHGLAQFIVGFRWLQWNENLQMQDTYDTVTDLGPIVGTDLYRTDCFNNLYGGQIGIDAILLGHASGFHIDGLVKAGAFYNDASQRSTYAYVDTSPFEFTTSNRTGSPDGAAFVGEVGMTAVIPVRCNLDLRVGYVGLWIEGLAQPTNQLSKQTLTQIDPPTGSLDTTGGVLVQGLSLGLEGRW